MTQANEAYTGAPYKVNKEYAEHFTDHWVILSAKYGFISPSFLIPGPYNVTFKKQSSNPVSVAVLREQVLSNNLDNYVKIIGLGGKEYRAMIQEAFAGYNIPMYFPFKGLPIGKAMQATKQAIKLNDSEMKENNSIPKKLCDTITHLELVKKPSKSIGQFTASTSRVREETKRKKDTIDIEIIWKMIGDHAGEIFRQIRGGEFTYVMKGNAVIPDRTNVQISKAHFIEALEHYPLSNTVPLQKLRGPSYIYAILMDKRIYQN